MHALGFTGAGSALRSFLWLCHAPFYFYPHAHVHNYTHAHSWRLSDVFHCTSCWKGVNVVCKVVGSLPCFSVEIVSSLPCFHVRIVGSSPCFCVPSHSTEQNQKLCPMKFLDSTELSTKPGSNALVHSVAGRYMHMCIIVRNRSLSMKPHTCFLSQREYYINEEHEFYNELLRKTPPVHCRQWNLMHWRLQNYADFFVLWNSND